MSFKPYPAYKDSGVEWLGEVPKHWEVQPLKRSIFQIESGTSVNAADVPAVGGSLGVLKTSCVYKGWFDWRENKTVIEEELDRVSCPLKLDTLIVSRMNTPELVGATGLVTEAPKGIFLPDRLWQVSFKKETSSHYIYYFTKSPIYRDQVKMVCSGTSSSMQNLGQDDFRSMRIAFPELTEQRYIASFLDYETTRIDSLITEQQRLIELLKEKRQAMISHAVTKGLDPTVPMKDSGVDMLGGIPTHWKVTRLKSIADLIDGDRGAEYPTDQDIVSEGIPFLSSKNILNYRFSALNLRFITPLKFDLLSRGKILDGDLAITVRGTIGHVAIYDAKEIGFKTAFINAQMMIVRPRCVSAIFLHNITESNFWKKQLEIAAYGSAQQQLSNEILRNVIVALPPPHEEAEIVDYIKNESTRIEKLLYDAKRGIELLQERRSALIAAAVTGKIDVRDWQPPTSAAKELEAVHG